MHLIMVEEDSKGKITYGNGVMEADTRCGAKFVGNLITEHKIAKSDSTRNFMISKISPQMHN